MMCNHIFMTFGCDKNGDYRICSKCNKKIYTITNADCIRAMTNEQLADLLCTVRWKMSERNECIEWLNQDSNNGSLS